MATIYCDNCGKDDQSITVSALLGYINQAQVSESYGSILNPGESPTLYRSTAIRAADPNVARQQNLARRFIRGEGFLPQGKICPDNTAAKSLRRSLRNVWYVLAVPLSFVITLPIGFSLLMGLEQPTRNNVGYFIMALIAGAIMYAATKWNTSFVNKCDREFDSWWEGLTSDEKALWRKLQDGSYCRRCDSFSPAH
jgi:hypothetical protein